MDIKPLPQAFGPALRDWRIRRHLSQMDLAIEAEISTRHLSFLETGRARPSREMVLKLAERLTVPMRERNALLSLAGFAAVHGERTLDAPDMAAARNAIERLLKAHEPYPALAVDRHWTLVMANAAVGPFLEGAAAHLLTGPINVLRLSLHPEGLAPRIRNLPEWRAHVLERLRAQFAASADPAILALLDELWAYPAPPGPRAHLTPGHAIVTPLVLDGPDGPLSFISTTTVFGTPLDVTLSEIAVEAFFPADDETARRLSAR
ncbi:helix-turn-helix transcriptional regulator [Brevundimonas sp. BR2-1]|uniref:helix-turn-helix domain-containing protein n=1 Tax=unclassified Brevundimonas TaxID=2622653 RepID=UPI002FCBCB78